MDTRNTFVLFHSNYCQHCKDFIEKLQKVGGGLYQKFTLICVDNNQSIPKSIQSVPTILVPSHEHPLTDSSVFMWLDTLASNFSKENNNSNWQKSVEAGPPQKNSEGPVAQNSEVADNENITPYIACEMGGGFSDSFSFLNTDGTTGNPMEHNFQFLTDNIANSGGAINDSSGAISNNQISAEQLGRPELNSDSKNSSNFDVAYEQYMSTRDGDPFIQQQHRRC
jgi:hypothetical protein